MTSETLVSISAIVLSLLFSYIPSLAEKFDALDGAYKRLVMLGLLVVVSATIFALSCTEYAMQLGINVSCTSEGAIGLLKLLIWAVMANQTAYAITPKASKG